MDRFSHLIITSGGAGAGTKACLDNLLVTLNPSHQRFVFSA
jgi:hypothetical protein